MGYLQVAKVVQLKCNNVYDVVLIKIMDYQSLTSNCYQNNYELIKVNSVLKYKLIIKNYVWLRSNNNVNCMKKLRKRRKEKVLRSLILQKLLLDFLIVRLLKLLRGDLINQTVGTKGISSTVCSKPMRNAKLYLLLAMDRSTKQYSQTRCSVLKAIKKR